MVDKKKDHLRDICPKDAKPELAPGTSLFSAYGHPEIEEKRENIKTLSLMEEDELSDICHILRKEGCLRTAAAFEEQLRREKNRDERFGTARADRCSRLINEIVYGVRYRD